MRPFDPATDGAGLEAVLHRTVIGGWRKRRWLIGEWLRGVTQGLVLPGPSDAYLFYQDFGPKVRIDNVLAPVGQLDELLDCGLPVLRQRYPIIVSQADAWSRVFGESWAAGEASWQRHDFCSLRVLVLESKLPAHRKTTAPKGYRISGWSDDHVPLAAQLMAQSPDPLQQRVPTCGRECLEVIRSACDFSLGGLAWDGQRLAGFVTVRPRFGIGQLFVLPQDQGRGVGGALLDLALRQLHQLSVRRARLTMIAGNQVAWSLYSGRGFRSCDEYPFRYWLTSS